MFYSLLENVSVFRKWRPFTICFLGAFYVLLHLYAGFYGPPEAILFRSLHVGLALCLVFLYFPLNQNKKKFTKIVCNITDFFLIIGSIWIGAYFIVELETWDLREVFMRPQEYLTALVLVILVLEATRRAIGPVLPVICIIFLLHAKFADKFSGILFAPPATFERLASTLLLGSDGVFGITVAIMAQFVVLFIFFGTLLNESGSGKFYTRLAFALFGNRTGGPAKAAVVSSAMMGSLSGSSIGNVMTTGAFTIPLMNRLGYRPSFSGGVEAAASNGGIIMPPVMGAVAFIMAEFLNRSYLEIILAAAIPALLYYLVIFISVHLEAKKLRLATMDRKDLPSVWPIIKSQGHLVLPLILIIIALILGYSIVYVAVVIIAATFLLALLQKINRMNPVRLIDTIEKTARSTVGLSVTAASAGIIIGAIFVTGLSFQISQAAVDLSGGQLWILLLIAAIMALIMGMGMTASAVYITLLATVIPILVKAGVPDIAAHFFAFYYGIISNITPPVAFTAFAAAPIAGSTPMKTALQASRLGAATFLLPICFIYSPALLLEGSTFEVISVSFWVFIGLLSLTISLTGYLINNIFLWERVLFFVAAMLIIFPGEDFKIYGSVIFLIALVTAIFYRKKIRDTLLFSDDGVLLVKFNFSIKPLDKFVRKLSASRVEKVASQESIIKPTPAADLAKELMQDKESDGSTKNIKAKGLFIAWTVIIVLSLILESMAQYSFHSTDPILWIFSMMCVSFVGVLSIAIFWKKSYKINE